MPIKRMLWLAFLLTFGSSEVVQAKGIENNKITISPARISKLVNLVDKPHIQVNIVIESLRGSTDLSPSLNAYFTLYSRNEIFTTEAVFPLGSYYEFISAERISGGIYQVTLMNLVDMASSMKKITYKIDARKAIVEMKKINCVMEGGGIDFQCDESTHFKSKIKYSIIKRTDTRY